MSNPNRFKLPPTPDERAEIERKQACRLAKLPHTLFGIPVVVDDKVEPSPLQKALDEGKAKLVTWDEWYNDRLGNSG
jgi:hypothetical protein